jgi:DNA-binding response OmpR family regulator
MYALLIAEDPDDIAIFSLALQRAGLAVTPTRELEKAMQGWAERPADLVLLALPTPSPPEQVRRVRAETLAPLIVIIHSSEEGLHLARKE